MRVARARMASMAVLTDPCSVKLASKAVMHSLTSASRVDSVGDCATFAFSIARDNRRICPKVCFG